MSKKYCNNCITKDIIINYKLIGINQYYIYCVCCLLKNNCSSIDPIDSNPIVTDPVDSNPIVTDPVDSNPIVTDPVDSNPTVTDPIDSNPNNSDPIETIIAPIFIAENNNAIADDS